MRGGTKFHILTLSRLVHLQPCTPNNRVNRVSSVVLSVEVQDQLSKVLKLVRRSVRSIAHNRWQWQGKEDIFPYYHMAD